MKTIASVVMALLLAIVTALPVSAQQGGERRFPETGFSLKGSFRVFWERHGGLPVFGFPLSNEVGELNTGDGNIYTVQYLERQRYEFHPENRGTVYEVLLGLLGVEALARQGRDWNTFPKANPSAPNYFSETGQAIAPQFLDYWRNNGLEFDGRGGKSFQESLALFGYPISQAQMENNAGIEVLTQWFQRARFEYHPNNPNPYKVLLGRLGAEQQVFHTATPAMLKASGNGLVYPIISTGDRLPNGYRYELLPDGLGLVSHGFGIVDVFSNHETSTVPFPAIGQPGAAADYRNAEISRLKLSQKSASVFTGELVWKSEQNYVRFCSGYLSTATAFQHPIYFTGEESSDRVAAPPAPAWPAGDVSRQAGLAVAVDTVTNQQYVIAGMGRMNHENVIVLPSGYLNVVALTTDDTFTAPSAQLYMYLATTGQDLLEDKGELYAFVSDNAAINDYGDMAMGIDTRGRFIPVPREIALGSQEDLENWSNANNAFQFIRTEDIAYDKNNPRVIYLADTGEPRAVADAATGRLVRGSSTTRGPYPNGRIFKLTLNDLDPLVVDSFQILIDADAAGYNNQGALHNPDNLDVSTTGSLMIQEDPGGHNNYDPGAGPSARIWRYDLRSGQMTVVAEVDQSLDPKARAGSWESSGIVDASSVFGPGTWLVNIQAHSLWVEQVQAEGYIRKLEGGQLVLLRVPGS